MAIFMRCNKLMSLFVDGFLIFDIGSRNRNGQNDGGKFENMVFSISFRAGSFNCNLISP